MDNQPPQRPQQPPQPRNPPDQPAVPGASKIQHTKPGIGQPQKNDANDSMAGDLSPLPMSDTGPALIKKKITAIERSRRHEDKWSRTPNTTGSGAIHVKTFHAKLTDDALAYMDQTINEWLDAHPQYEVKFVSSSIGILTGKLKDPNLICQVWV